MRIKDFEKGQAIILLVLSMVGLLGFTALAIDGGLIYSDRRIAQNAADATALAGAERAGELLNGVVFGGWFCPEGDAEESARLNAFDNDFTISKVDDLNSVENGVAAVCNDAAHYVDVHVKLTTQTQTAFAHFVFSGVLKNTVEAVARVYGQIPVGGGKALLALDKDCNPPVKGGMEFKGNEEVNVVDGDVHSNCDMTFSGSTGLVDVTNGDITYNDDFGDQKGPPPAGTQTVNPPPVGNSEYITVDIDPPVCTGSNNGDADGMVGGNTINPGIYDDITVNASAEELTLNPGLYCINGKFKISGGQITGNGVTLYFPSSAGAINTEGDAIVDLAAPDPQTCESAGICPPAIGGVLIYFEPGGSPSSPDISLGGTSGSTYSGMIYAPEAEVNVGGTSNMVGGQTIDYGISVVAFGIKIFGNTDINITYDADKMPQEDAWIRMER